MVTSDPRYLFYSLISTDRLPGILPAQYSWSVWRPSRFPLLPPALPGKKLRLRFLFRWLLHRTHLFAGDQCGALLIREGTRLVHYSAFTPRFWRFPFLADRDLQIGDTWTDPAYRGKGLALFALQTVVRLNREPQRRFWYVVQDVNLASIRVVEKADFTLSGEGTWIKPWGLKLLGSYVMRTATDLRDAVCG
jgi:RimJ/RimL family protein N-acetyltransferase